MKYTLICAVGILIGIAFGLLLGVAVLPAPSRGSELRDTTRLSQIAISLRMLRSNKSDLAAEALEGLLDSDLVTLAGLARVGKVEITNNKDLKLVKKYRADYPRSKDANVDALVAEVLGQVKVP
jgi:hypothetical protein